MHPHLLPFAPFTNGFTFVGERRTYRGIADDPMIDYE